MTRRSELSHVTGEWEDEFSWSWCCNAPPARRDQGDMALEPGERFPDLEAAGAHGAP